MTKGTMSILYTSYHHYHAILYSTSTVLQLGVISYSPPSIIHYTTYVYMSCEGYTNTSTVLDATIGIQTIGVYL